MNRYYHSLKALKVLYYLDVSILAPTEIYLNENDQFQDGYKISVTIGDQEIDDYELTTIKDNYISLYTINPTYHKQLVSILITQKVSVRQGIVDLGRMQVKYDIEEISGDST